MSAHVSRALLPSLDVPPKGAMNDESVMRPHDAFADVANGTVTWCVTSCTESMRPAAPQNTCRSAARATPDVTVSRSRCGTLPTVEYPCGWKMRTVSLPGL